MKRTFGALLLALTVSISSQAQEKLTFKLNPVQGKTIPFEVLVKSDISGPQNVIMDMTMTMDMTATQVSDQEIIFESKYNRMKMDADAAGASFSYDSDRAPANEIEEALSTQLKPILENTLTMSLDRQGKVLSMNFPNVPSQAFDMNSAKGMSIEFPSHPIAIGDSWNSDAELQQFNIKGTNKNTYVEKTAQGFKIKVEGSYKNDEGEELGRMDGYYILDPKTCYTVESKIRTEMSIQGTKIISSMDMKELK